ncbi:hypothetical protein [Nocardia sp. NPDC005998]|uniref:hypothetical protein n=1 Tax=Nocardia sp. NPDC005998 TaxID=3156894 RepID=UPI0033AB5266
MPPNDERPFDSRPHFVIPYWNSTDLTKPGDDGDVRPVPANKAVWYLCESIHASPYQPGQQLDVTVDIANYGGANTPSIAQVTVWWSDPTAGFVVGPDNLIGYRTVDVPPRGGRNTTLVMSKVIPPSAPNHICLLARVSHQYDRAGVVVDPVNDRHWAQRNLVAAAAQPGVPVVLPFLVGNPFQETTEFLVLAKQVREAHFEALANAVGGQPIFAEAQLTVSDREDGRGEDRLRLTLEPGEQRRLYVSIGLANRIDRGQFAPFEVSQQREGDETPAGGLGFIING